MLINKIKKMSGNKYKIYIDSEELITYDDVILENDLLYKKNIDLELYNKILSDTIYYDVYNKVVKYISKRMRSEREILLYLQKFDIKEYQINNIIKKLKSINLINDKEYCRAYINDRIYLYKDGINKIKSDLLKENISIDIINNEIEKIDINIVNDKLEKLVLKKIKSNNKYSNYQLKQKILNDMINLGYNKDSILNIIENNIKSDSEILNKEFNKVYNHLKIKYSGLELKNKIKQKLVSKGFSLSDINLLLDEVGE